MPAVEEHCFKSADALARALAAALAKALATGIAARGAASLVVSGGRTPRRLFTALAATPLAWDAVWITLTDERWVACDAADSNEAFVRAHLVTGQAGRARFVPLKNDAADAARGAPCAWQAVAAIPRPFDAVVLGMGDDGHTASLFPHAPGIVQALDPAAAPAFVAMTAPVAPHARISLNLAALVATRHLALHIEGAAKWDVYQRLRRAEIDAPLGAVLRAAQPTPAVYWAP